MCIRLIRTYRCPNATGTSTQEHSRSWIVRCSTPDIHTEAILEGYSDQPCLQALDELIENYDTPCDDCTGHICVELESPSDRSEQPFKKDLPENRERESSAAKNYFKSLLNLLSVSLQVRSSKPANDVAKRRDKMIYILRHIIPELHCRQDPSHGYYNMFREEECPCPKLKRALHNNPATEVRTRIAMALYQPIHTKLEPGHEDYDDTVRKWEEYVEKCHRAIPSRNSRQAEGSSEPIIPWVRPFNPLKTAERKEFLLERLGEMMGNQELSISDMFLTAFVREAIDIIAIDTGLTQSRALSILNLFQPMLQSQHAWQLELERRAKQPERQLDPKLSNILDSTDPDELCRVVAEFIDSRFRNTDYSDFEAMVATKYPHDGFDAYVDLVQVLWHDRLRAITERKDEVLGGLKRLTFLDVRALKLANEHHCCVCGVEFLGDTLPVEHPLRIPRCRHVVGERCMVKWVREQQEAGWGSMDFEKRRARLADKIGCPVCVELFLAEHPEYLPTP